MDRMERKNKLPQCAQRREAQSPEASRQIPEKEEVVLNYRDRIRSYGWPVAVVVGSIVAAALVGNYNCKKREEAKNREALSAQVRKIEPPTH